RQPVRAGLRAPASEAPVPAALHRGGPGPPKVAPRAAAPPSRRPDVISVTALSGGLKASYYTGPASMEPSGPERYYVHGGPGTWLGAGAAALGLSGRVEEGQLSALLRGHSPKDDSPLVQAQKCKDRRERQAGWDITLSDPKSLSALWAVADPQLR